MRLHKYVLLGFVFAVTGACGARTGEYDDYFYANGGGFQTGSVTATGGNPAVSTGGSRPIGGSYATWTTAGWTGWGGTTSYWYTGGATYWNTGGSYYGGSPSCLTGNYGCACWYGSYCNSPYSCVNNLCLYVSGTGGATSFGGSTYRLTGGATFRTGGASPTGGKSSYGGYSNIGGYSSIGGFTSYAGSTSVAGRTSTGGTQSVLDKCIQAVGSCVSDQGCRDIVSCAVAYGCTNYACYISNLPDIVSKCGATATTSSLQLLINVATTCA